MNRVNGCCWLAGRWWCSPPCGGVSPVGRGVRSSCWSPATGWTRVPAHRLHRRVAAPAVRPGQPDPGLRALGFLSSTCGRPPRRGVRTGLVGRRPIGDLRTGAGAADRDVVLRPRRDRARPSRSPTAHHHRTQLGINKFLLCSGSPRWPRRPGVHRAILFAVHGQGRRRYRHPDLSKVNQWTLLVGSLPWPYLAGGGGTRCRWTGGNREVLLTAPRRCSGCRAADPALPALAAFTCSACSRCSTCCPVSTPVSS